MTQVLDTGEQRIYVACLAAYNNGILHGKWIDANQEIDEIWNNIRDVLAASPVPEAEEWAIHDFEGFAGVRLHEYESIEHVHDLVCFLEDHDEAGALVLDYHDGDIEAAKQTLENHMGCFRSLAEYAQSVVEDTTEVPSHLERYIDYEQIGKDMELGGELFTIEARFDEIHVFLEV